MSDWLKHTEAAKDAAKSGKYDEAREHFLKADRAQFKSNPHFHHSDMGHAHQASDHELATRYGEKPTDPIAKIDHMFALNKLSKTRHPNQLLSITNKRMKKSFSQFTDSDRVNAEMEKQRSHNRHLRSKVARNKNV